MVDYDQGSILKSSTELKRTKREDFVFENSSDQYYLKKGFTDYLFLHNSVDIFSWILKLFYADDKDVVKKRKFRLEVIFQNYFIKNKIKLNKVSSILAVKVRKNDLESFLLRGWYNELIAAYPATTYYLDIGVNLDARIEDKHPGDQGDFTWKIVQHYYSILDFTRLIVMSADPDKYPEKVGYGISKVYNNNIKGKLINKLLFYPFVFDLKTVSSIKHPKYCDFWYSNYPRETLSLKESEEFLLQSYLCFKKSRDNSKIDVLDYLYELRTWANYMQIEPLLELNTRKSGYMKFMLKNLSTINFFFAGFAEIMYIAKFGEKSYLDLLIKFSRDYIEKVDMFGKENFILPLYVRLRVYKHLDYLSGGVEEVFNKTDPIKLVAWQSVVSKSKND